MKKFLLEPAYVAELLKQSVRGTICESLLLDILRQTEHSDEVKKVLNDLIDIRIAETLMMDEITPQKQFTSHLAIEAIKELLKKI